jgi:tRNA(Ile)-lysidine synthase
MMKTARRVQEFIGKHQLLADDARVLVALSGGADSVALLRILLSLEYRCHAVHCNFHLRGEESDRDERFVTALCHTLGVECEVVHFDTLGYAAEQKVSVEMAARELRYREFERLRQAHNLDAIAVAHHQDDAVETLLLNLIRGAGINGLTGMKVRNGHVVRPLLCLTRDEIIDYLDHLGQPYVTDSTNLTDAYARNKVRLNLLPLMQQINPAAKDNIMQAALHLGEAATIYNKVIEETKTRLVTTHAEGIDIEIAALLDTEVPQTHLFEIVHPYGFNSTQVADIFRSLTAEAGRLFESADYTLLRDRTHLLLRRNNPEGDNYQLSILHSQLNEGLVQLPDGTQLIVTTIEPDATWSVPKRSDVLCLDLARINQPLTLRHPRQGDRFCPFGMKGSKLLSDFYTDLKLPHTEKAKQWVLCHGEEIVWAVGLRGSEKFRLKGTPERVICIERLKINDER